MNLKYSFVCDSAVVGMNGNLSVMNIFHNLGAQQFPVTIPKMVFVAVLQFHRSEQGLHKFKLSFADDDGRDVIPAMAGELKAAPQSLNANLLAELVGINIPRAGTYQLDLTVDNSHITSQTITVTQVIAQPKQ